MTYELLLEIFSMEKLNILLYRNCSVNFFTKLLHFTLPPEPTWAGSAVARVSEAPPEISRGAPHTLLAYYYELQ